MSTLVGIIMIVMKVLFISRTTNSLNMVPLPGDKNYRDPTACTLLALFIPFYTLYWIYKMSRRIDILLDRSGYNESVTALYTILGLFVQPVALILMYLKLQQFAEGM